MTHETRAQRAKWAKNAPACASAQSRRIWPPLRRPCASSRGSRPPQVNPPPAAALRPAKLPQPAAASHSARPPLPPAWRRAVAWPPATAPSALSPAAHPCAGTQSRGQVTCHHYGCVTPGNTGEEADASSSMPSSALRKVHVTWHVVGLSRSTQARNAAQQSFHWKLQIGFQLFVGSICWLGFVGAPATALASGTMRGRHPARPRLRRAAPLPRQERRRQQGQTAQPALLKRGRAAETWRPAAAAAAPPAAAS